VDYREYVKICTALGYVGIALPLLAREALLPRARHLRGNRHAGPQVRALPAFQAHPEVLRVPARRLKRWAMRAFREVFPREQLMHGPALTMMRRQRVIS